MATDAVDRTEDTYLNVDETAELLRCEAHAVRRLIKSGRLPALRLGRVYRIKRSDIDAALKV